jgi:hypothetical protein
MKRVTFLVLLGLAICTEAMPQSEPTKEETAAWIIGKLKTCAFIRWDASRVEPASDYRYTAMALKKVDFVDNVLIVESKIQASHTKADGTVIQTSAGFSDNLIDLSQVRSPLRWTDGSMFGYQFSTLTISSASPAKLVSCHYKEHTWNQELSARAGPRNYKAGVLVDVDKTEQFETFSITILTTCDENIKERFTKAMTNLIKYSGGQIVAEKY